MLVLSSLKSLAIEAEDGRIGVVSDFLFDDTTWKLRWMVVDTGSWLPGRRVLIHPSAIGQPDFEGERVPVRLTRARIEGSPDIAHDQPVSQQMENDLHGYYGWDPGWGGGGYFGGFPIGMEWPVIPLRHRNGAALLEAEPPGVDFENGDPHLRSAHAMVGYHIHATDGQIGHVENILVDEADWSIRYLIVDTRNWWPGEHVLLSPYAVTATSWAEREMQTSISRDQVKAGPKWDPLTELDVPYERQLHGHYGWAGYGW